LFARKCIYIPDQNNANREALLHHHVQYLTWELSFFSSWRSFEVPTTAIVSVRRVGDQSVWTSFFPSFLYMCVCLGVCRKKIHRLLGHSISMKYKSIGWKQKAWLSERAKKNERSHKNNVEIDAFTLVFYSPVISIWILIIIRLELDDITTNSLFNLIVCAIIRLCIAFFILIGKL